MRPINLSPEGVTIGRQADNDLVLDDPTVSGHHARVAFNGTKYQVLDLESTNGTFLAKDRVQRLGTTSPFRATSTHSALSRSSTDWCTPSQARPIGLPRPYLRTASTIRRPSRMVRVSGFSAYTSLPAWQAWMHTSARQ